MTNESLTHGAERPGLDAMASTAGPSWSYTEKDAAILLAGLVGVEAALVAVYVITQLVVPSWDVLGSLFDLGLDQSIPSWFSATQLAALGAAFLLAARVRHSGSGLPAWLLVALSVVAIYLSADEGAGIHERITTAMADADVTWLLFRGNHGGWVSVYAVVLVVGAVLARRWLLALWTVYRRETLLALVGVVVYLAGAAGIEVLGFETESGSTSGLDVARIALEELMEMAGASIVLYAALLLALHVGSPPADEGVAPHATSRSRIR